MGKVKIVLADDHSLIRDGIRLSLESHTGFDIVGEAGSGKEAIAVVNKLHPDILILDISMPDLTGMEVAKVLQGQCDTRVLFLTQHDDPAYILECINCGAKGYILKDTQRAELIKAIQKIAAGENYFTNVVYEVVMKNYGSAAPSTKEEKKTVVNEDGDLVNLTKREREVLKYVIQGMTSAKIAKELFISARTIDTHRMNIMNKLKVKNAAELVKKALEQSLI